MARIWVLLLVCALLLMPGAVQAQAAGLRGARGTGLAGVMGTDCCTFCQYSRNLICGVGESAGTFHATVFGASAAGGLGGMHVQGEVTNPRSVAGSSIFPIKAATMVVAGRQNALESGSDGIGPLGEQQDALRAEPSHRTGEVQWELLVAVWALLGAALLLRGAHRLPACWDGNDAS